MNYAIEFKNITKTFPGVLANDQVSFNVKKNEVHCILGENGSGKSTMMNILFGLYQADEGDIFINGKKSNIKNPQDAHDLGIGMVHQHFMLVEQMTALENIILGKESDNFKLNMKESYKQVKEIVEQYGFQLDLNKKVRDLSIGMKQRVEILKTLYRGADTIILDEPSAVLTPSEVEELFEIIRNLKSSGKTIIFITHKLNEIMETADRVTVIRKGKIIKTVDKNDTNASELSYMMVGRNVETITSNIKSNLGQTVLEIRDLKLLTTSQNNISFDIKSGEIFGIAGVEGNGQLELEEFIIGLRKYYEGDISIYNTNINTLNPKQRKKLGIGYIPSDRYKRAILPTMSVNENFLLGFHDESEFNKFGFIKKGALIENTRNLIEKFDIRGGGPNVNIGTLSGGNQQKIVLARETSRNPELVVAAQPTRGLDVGAIEYIHKNLLELKSRGKAILLISAELSEVMNLSDRIGVIFEGEIREIIERENFDREKIGYLMAGN